MKPENKPAGELSICAHIIIKGKVQGVYFRHNLKKIATENDVRGWVQNLENGSVESHLEGTPTSVKKVIEWSKKGPEGADVKEVIIQYEEYGKNYHEFEIIG